MFVPERDRVLMRVCVCARSPALPDIEGAFLTGAQGA